MKRLAFRIAAVAALAFSFAGAASAQTHWDAAHSRRDEVNDRLANQNRRIHNEVREGELSHAQAMTLHRDDRQIRREERLMAHQDNSHITKQEQRTLNQQENRVSTQIGH
ncbi:hypothetical protein [Trinickia sp.]|uniref:hypothetical protein n=1 Tax=Trinickia sp. TaxID=2571163 RepID=UPI003F7DD9F0